MAGVFGEKAVEYLATLVDWRKPRAWLVLLTGPLIGAFLLNRGPAFLQLNEHAGNIRQAIQIGTAILAGIFIWCAVLAAFGLMREVWQLASKMEDARNQPSDDAGAMDEARNSAYASMDDEERAVLALFVEHGTSELSASFLVSQSHEREQGLVQAAHRLKERGFLSGEELSDSNPRFGYWRMLRVHFRTLTEKPSLVGSRTPPKTFGTP